MCRKILIAWLVIAAVVLSTISGYAGDQVQGTFFLRNIVINGEKIVNYNLQYPFFLYNDTTYFPLTKDMQAICGVEAGVQDGSLSLRKTEPLLANVQENWVKNNAESVTLAVDYEAGLRVTDAPDASAQPPWDNSIALGAGTESPVKDETLDLNESPVLLKDKVTYLPVRALTESKLLGWDLYYDPYYGLCISTSEGIPAESYFPAAEANYNRGLVSYIKSKNSSLSTSRTQELVFLFRRAAEINSVDEKLLIAIAQKESTFRADARSSAGAAGLMQIMPKTAAGSGISSAQLYDAKTSIDFGASYISNQINSFDGNVNMALSAYNQGPGSVSRGTYSRGYAEKVQGIVADIGAHLETGGYLATE
ncbi:MAG: transglycosylase SLT domain-containing protein [Clostridiales Family XIII bacterium]|jgi:hypothetical protein|nr:transglycosylase SLT domain-containing protein [Clostridiales Family XIII bacterium]